MKFLADTNIIQSAAPIQWCCGFFVCRGCKRTISYGKNKEVTGNDGRFITTVSCKNCKISYEILS